MGGLLRAALAGSASKVISGIFGFLTSALIVLLIVDAVYAFVLPLMPYVMRFLFVAGMLILTVEAVITVPLWAFFHIRMDGREFVDQVQRLGYMIMFNLLLRMPLAMLGLFFSYLVLDALAWFIHQTFIAAAAVTSTRGYGIIGLLTLMIMVVYLHYQAAIRSFGLITQVPDRVSRWFGQGGEITDAVQVLHISRSLNIVSASRRADRRWSLIRAGTEAGAPGGPVQLGKT
ncbi:DotA/TraY family protein [Azospirillum sp. Vi22]|nr:DotA/TraY family protein [Azospirillum baldaniorum]